MIDEPILITGASRSGTSMTAGIINLCGAHGGLIEKRGTYENYAISQSIVAPVLRCVGADPHGQDPLPDLELDEVIEKLKLFSLTWASRVVRVMRMQEYDGVGRWFYKSAKTCLLWPLWNEAFPRAHWVVVRRSAKAIAESCMRTGYMKAYTTLDSWLLWVYEYEYVFARMEEAGLNVTEIWPENIVQGDMTEIKALVERLGLSWDDEQVSSFIAPAIWKSERRRE